MSPARSRLRWFTARARLPPSPPPSPHLPRKYIFWRWGSARGRPAFPPPASLSSIPKIKPCSSPPGCVPPPFPGADTHRSAGSGAGRLRRTNPALSAAGRAQCGACSPRAPALESATVCAPGKQGRGAGGGRVLCCLPGSLAARCHPVPAAPAPAPSHRPAPLSPGFDSFFWLFSRPASLLQISSTFARVLSDTKRLRCVSLGRNKQEIWAALAASMWLGHKCCQLVGLNFGMCPPRFLLEESASGTLLLRGCSVQLPKRSALGGISLARMNGMIFFCQQGRRACGHREEEEVEKCCAGESTQQICSLQNKTAAAAALFGHPCACRVPPACWGGQSSFVRTGGCLQPRAAPGCFPREWKLIGVKHAGCVPGGGRASPACRCEHGAG